jgi:predicted transcriptional regulator
MGYISQFESKVMELVKNHNGICIVEIYENLQRKKMKLSIHTLRHVLRKLVNEKKLVKTGIHQFKYYPPDSRVVEVNAMWKNMFSIKPVSR